ncbi:MAG: T9SS type A sorting domain-containing protein [bacterium]|nr:T9SS type A sorting domain-containing protein [bacterium]
MVRTVPTDYATLQAALDSTQTGDTVLVLPGLYEEAAYSATSGVTICSLFLLSGDTADIASTRLRGFTNGDDTLRALTLVSAGGIDPSVRIVGIHFTRSSASSLDDGGALSLIRLHASVEYCVFDSCAARAGGAIFVNESWTKVSNCRFNRCALHQAGSVLHSAGSIVELESCLIVNSFSFEDPSESPQLFWVLRSNLRLRNCDFRHNGHDHNWLGTVIVSASKPPDTVEIIGSRFTDNRIEKMLNGESIDFFRLDSNTMWGNELSQALYSQSGTDSLTRFQAIGNIFETFTPVAGAQMHGLFALDTSSHHITIVERNLVHDIHGGHTSFCNILGDNEFERSVKHNYVLNNSVHSITWPPSGSVLVIGTGDGELEENVFMGNEGYAVYQGPLNLVPFARHNYWGDASGPYDSLTNPGGQGDTVEWRVVYQPWEADTSFMSAPAERPAPVAIPESFIGNAYPNPFNSAVTIEFVLLKAADVTLTVYDITGREVAQVLDARVPKGAHIREWRPAEHASGIYFARLETHTGAHSTAKLLFLK